MGLILRQKSPQALPTFLAMAYILGVNPVVLSDGGMPATGVFFATAVSSAVACFIMGLVAKYPVGLFVTAIIGVIFTACGFSAGDALMPTLPAHIVSVNFDVSLFCGFTKWFEQLFSNIPNLIMILFSLVLVTFFDTTWTLMSLGRQCGFIDEEGQAVGIEKAFLADAVGGVVGAVVCTSTVLRTLSSLLVSLFFFFF